MRYATLVAILLLAPLAEATEGVPPKTSDTLETGGCNSEGYTRLITSGTDKGKMQTCLSGTWTLIPDPTAAALEADPADCSANQFANAIAADGDLTCAAIVDADVPDTITIDLAAEASALAANPTDCSANQYATAIAASGNLTCAQPDHGLLAGLGDDDHTQYFLADGSRTLTGELVTSNGSFNSTVVSGDIFQFEDNGTDIFRVSDGQNIVLNGKRLFVTANLDEDVYDWKWGQIVLAHTETRDFNNNEFAAFRMDYNAKFNDTSASNISRGYGGLFFASGTSNAVNTDLHAIGGGLFRGYFNVGHTGVVMDNLWGGVFDVQSTSTTAATLGNVHPVLVRSTMLPQNMTIGQMSHVQINGPYTPGTGTTITEYAALEIDNQASAAAASTNHYAILVNSQAVSSASKGNVRLAGAAYNNGHLDLGGWHVWKNGSTDLRFKYGAPTSASDGTAFGAGGDSHAYGEFYTAGFLAATVTSGTPAKLGSSAGSASTAGDLSEFTHTSAGRITYTGTDTEKFLVNGTLTVSVDTAAQTLELFLYKNGTVVTKCNQEDYFATASQDQSMGLDCIVELATNDYLEYYVDTTSGTVIVTADLATLVATELF